MLSTSWTSKVYRQNCVYLSILYTIPLNHLPRVEAGEKHLQQLQVPSLVHQWTCAVSAKFHLLRDCGVSNFIIHCHYRPEVSENDEPIYCNFGCHVISFTRRHIPLLLVVDSQRARVVGLRTKFNPSCRRYVNLDPVSGLVRLFGHAMDVSDPLMRNN